MRRTLFPAVLAALGLSLSALGAWGQADLPLFNTPASYRLFNPSTMGPRTSGCGRCEPLPCGNPGCFLDNPRGTGSDDPWRPPHCWPQTRYPVVPAYTRPSYGYYETSWRVLPLCNPTPTTAGPIYPAGFQLIPPGGAVPQAQPGNAPGSVPRPPVVPPAVQPAQPGSPAATPPAATPPVPQPAPAEAVPGGPPTAVPVVPLQPQKATPATNELQPSPPKATPPANPPRKGLNQGALPFERDAMLDLRGEEAPEIRVQPF